MDLRTTLRLVFETADENVYHRVNLKSFFPIDQINYLEKCEIAVSIIFFIEYLIRVYAEWGHGLRTYIFSFFGILDFLTIVPSIVRLIVDADAGFFLTLRVLRLLKVFHMLHMEKFEYASEAIYLQIAATKYRFFVFLFCFSLLVFMIGSAIYAIEGGTNGYDNLPISCYWAIVTLTTVGYGDISPTTYIGRILASGVMMLGYAIIAVPSTFSALEIASKPRRGSGAWDDVLIENELKKLMFGTKADVDHSVLNEEKVDSDSIELLALTEKATNAKSKICPKCSFSTKNDLSKFCKYCASELQVLEYNKDELAKVDEEFNNAIKSEGRSQSDFKKGNNDFFEIGSVGSDEEM